MRPKPAEPAPIRTRDRSQPRAQKHAARTPGSAGTGPSGDQTVRRFVTLACARGGFRAIVELAARIHRYIAEHDDHAKPSTWTTAPDGSSPS
jgi:hypothetical protein